MNTNRQRIARNHLAAFVTNVLTALCWVAIALTQLGFSQDARQSPDGIWRKIDIRSAPQLLSLYGDETQAHSALALNSQSLDRFLRSAPKEFSTGEKNKVEISLPFPDGTFQKFRIEESPISEIPLGSPGFQTRTFAGIGIDDPTATVRFETAFDGFHAVVRGASGVFYIDPTGGNAKTESYFSYFAAAKSRGNDQPHCEVSEDRTKREQQKKVGAEASEIHERRRTAERISTRPGREFVLCRCSVSPRSESLKVRPSRGCDCQNA